MNTKFQLSSFNGVGGGGGGGGGRQKDGQAFLNRSLYKISKFPPLYAWEGLILTYAKFEPSSFNGVWGEWGDRQKDGCHSFLNRSLHSGGVNITMPASFQGWKDCRAKVLQREKEYGYSDTEIRIPKPQNRKFQEAKLLV